MIKVKTPNDFLSELLSDLSVHKAEIARSTKVLDDLVSSEARLRSEIASYMLNNDIEKKTTPDGKYAVTFASKKSIIIRDKIGLTAYAKESRQDLLTIDVAKAKSDIKNDQSIAQYFLQTVNVGISVSEIKEKIIDIETPAQFRARVAASRGE